MGALAEWGKGGKLRDAVERDEASPAAGVSNNRAAKIGTGKALMDYVHGTQQLALRASELLKLGTTDTVSGDARRRLEAEVNENLKFYQTLKEDKAFATGAGEVVGDVAAGAVIPGGTLTKSAVGGAVQSGLDYQQNPEDLGKNMALGAAFGAGGHMVFSAVAKTLNGLRGRYKASKLAEIQALADANKIPLTPGDVSKSKFLETVDSLLERVPIVGTAGLRTKQAAKATDMLRRLREDYVRYVGDSPTEVADALFSKLNRSKAQVAKMYDEAERLAGSDPLIATNLAAQAKGIRDQLTKDIPDPSLWNKDVRALLDKYAGEAVLTYSGARQIRSGLKRELREAMKNQLIGDDEARTLGRLVTGIEQDIAAFATKRGGVLKVKQEAADRFYRSQVAPFKDQLLSKSLKDADFDLKLPGLLKNPVAARRFYAAADEQGRKALRFAMLDNAMQSSIVDDVVDPKKFVTAMNSQKRVFGEVFKGEDEKTMRGVLELMKRLKGVNRLKETPATGMGAFQQSITMGGPAAVVAGLATAPTTTATAVGILGTLRLALASNAGRRVVNAAADFKGDTKGWEILFQSLKKAAERNQLVIDGVAPAEDD